ncbi:MAG: hypothetical protein GY943_30565 [Chloroflexi bacterium]|nr:hypothetical protein [Chloroflexota bacterium]
MSRPRQPVTYTASKTLTKGVHGESIVNASAAAGMTITLPASSGDGTKITIFCLTTVTSNDLIIQVANATDVLSGGVSMSTDIGGTNMLTAATSDTITMNGSTKGGLIGSWVELEDVSSGFWKLNGFLKTTGTEATPFSAAVS